MMPMQNHQPLQASVFNDQSCMSSMSSAQLSQMQNISSQQPLNNFSSNNSNSNNNNNNQCKGIPNKMLFILIYEINSEKLRSILIDLNRRLIYVEESHLSLTNNP